MRRKEGTLEVPILKQGQFLIATFQAALSDADLNLLRRGLVAQVVRFRSRGVIVDVTAMDVMDSYASRTLREIAQMIRLRGAETVLVGIQPEVAFAMVQLGLTLEGVGRALAVEIGFSAVDSTFIATAISELARNIVSYAGKGEITLKTIQNSAREGILIVATDEGPGIHDIRQALRDGFSTAGSLGLGLT